jgi:hypothetical protein
LKAVKGRRLTGLGRLLIIIVRVRLEVPRWTT